VAHTVLVVTPNLCFDRTLWVDRLEAGTVSRPHRVEVTAGGKGVNVVRTLRDLGRHARLLGLVPDAQGAELERLLTEEGTELRPVRVAGAVRGATIILEADGRATVLNEPGPAVGEAECEALLVALAEELVGHPGRAVVVCAGSLPPGLPGDTYGRVVALVHEHGGIAVVDAAREALAATLPFGPDAVTPNLGEAQALLDGADTEHSFHDDGAEATREAATLAASRLHDRGARTAIVTAGVHGVAWVDEHGGAHWEASHRVVPVNPIGAGDSFVGGLVAGLAGSVDWASAVRFAGAVAGAAVEQPTAGRVDAYRVAELADSRSVLQ
jgi:1-phosphofructokinase family hexose kinase